MIRAIDLLVELYLSLPPDHKDRSGVYRAIEVLRDEHAWETLDVYRGRHCCAHNV